jgi:hypothetical protein
MRIFPVDPDSGNSQAHPNDLPVFPEIAFLIKVFIDSTVEKFVIKIQVTVDILLIGNVEEGLLLELFPTEACDLAKTLVYEVPLELFIDDYDTNGGILDDPLEIFFREYKF